MRIIRERTRILLYNLQDRETFVKPAYLERNLSWHQ